MLDNLVDATVHKHHINFIFDFTPGNSLLEKFGKDWLFLRSGNMISDISEDQSCDIFSLSQIRHKRQNFTCGIYGVANLLTLELSWYIGHRIQWVNLYID